eukprot:scaffold212796_cov27-Prasinocladus_malaysianus.AAC.1
MKGKQRKENAKEVETKDVERKQSKEKEGVEIKAKEKKKKRQESLGGGEVYGQQEQRGEELNGMEDKNN